MRAIWIGLMALVAILATGAELDRAARRAPAIAGIVPVPFRSFAQEQLTIATVRSAPPAEALHAAELLVRRRPVPSEHLSLLAIAQERAGRTDKSGLLVQMAARRGWRDPIAQQAMFAIALNAGDHAESSRRLAAMWALQDHQAPLADPTNKLLATEQGRAAMAETLKAGGRWLPAFLTGAPIQAPVQVAQTLALADRLGARFDCRATKRLAGFYKVRRMAAEAEAMRDLEGHCAPGK